MFDKPLNVANLSAEQRQALDDLYAIRAELSMRNIEANNLKRKVVQNPCEATESALEEYLDTFVRPLVRQQDDIQNQLRKGIFDKEKFKAMLPMVLTVLNQFVDMRMFIELTGLDLSSGHPIVEMIEKAMSSDIPSD